MAPLGLSLSPELVVLCGGDEGLDRSFKRPLAAPVLLSSSMPAYVGLEVTLLRLLALPLILLSRALSLSMLSSEIVGTEVLDEGVLPKNELRLMGEVRPGLSGPAFGDGPRYIFVTTLAAGQSEFARLWPWDALVDLDRAMGTLGAVFGSSLRPGVFKDGSS